MGTHPSAPSKIAGSDKFLIDYFKENPDAIGIVNTGADAYDLPFLFKVLSVDNALSIQVNYSVINDNTN
jgi:mannose-6-phosphate isomerase